jgi:hypothetical protein
MKVRCGFVMLPALLLGAWVSHAQNAAPPLEAELRLAGEFLIPPKTTFPELGASRFGAISGIATLPGGCELLAISDDDQDSRVYRMQVSGTGSTLQVRPIREIRLEGSASAPSTLDPEGIALTTAGTILISSEGAGNVEPRLPPAILEYRADGRFLRQLPVPPRFVPNARGPLRTGTRRNGGFESLAMTAGFKRFYTANELPLVQDGPDAPFTPGQRVRIVEYLDDGKGYAPAREFAYELAPLEQPTFPSGLTVNGLVELLQVDGDEFLALERGFIQSRGGRFGLNRIRLFRISLSGATDVSTIDALAGQKDLVPVRKTLVQDFSALAGRSLRLLNLENFEGLAWIGKGQGSERALLTVSDDNFNALQVTAFLLLEPAASAVRSPACP